MQGDVSRMGGTDAGVLPKYKNDMINKKILLIDWIQFLSIYLFYLIDWYENGEFNI